MATTVVVVNPQSQNGALGKQWPELAALLRRELGGFEHVLTTRPGRRHPADPRGARAAAPTWWSRSAATAPSTRWSTASSTTAAPIAPDAALGVLPVRHRRRLPQDRCASPRTSTTAARDPAPRDRRRTIDVGRLELPRAGDARRPGDAHLRQHRLVRHRRPGRPRSSTQSSKRLGGKRLVPARHRARRRCRYENQRVRLIFDDDEADAVEITINTVAVANGRYFGGGMNIAPDAELDDGLFDVVALGDLADARLLLHGSRALQRHPPGPGQGQRRGARARVEAPPGRPGRPTCCSTSTARRRARCRPRFTVAAARARTLVVRAHGRGRSQARARRPSPRRPRRRAGSALRWLRGRVRRRRPLVPRLRRLRHLAAGVDRDGAGALRHRARRPTRRAILFGWVAGIVANAGGFYWIINLLIRFAHLPCRSRSSPPAAVRLPGAGLRAVRLGVRRIRASPPLPMALIAPVVMVGFELLVPDPVPLVPGDHPGVAAATSSRSPT